MMRIAALVTVGILMTPSSFAVPLNYNINTDKTVVALSWHAFGSTLSHASLVGVTGDVKLDTDNDLDDRINVSIPVKTLVASNHLLTWQLKSGMFFDAERYPMIVFTSTRVVQQTAGHFRVFGSLKVKDIQRPVILDAVLNTQDDSNGMLALHVTTAIFRSAYNMDKLLAVVDDRVAIAIDIQAIAQSGT
jgi:polyisoprenoid-binding protein YceI